jgi:hypothetical protein
MKKSIFAISLLIAICLCGGVMTNENPIPILLGCVWLMVLKRVLDWLCGWPFLETYTPTKGWRRFLDWLCGWKPFLETSTPQESTNESRTFLFSPVFVPVTLSEEGSPNDHRQGNLGGRRRKARRRHVSRDLRRASIYAGLNEETPAPQEGTNESRTSSFSPVFVPVTVSEEGSPNDDRQGNLGGRRRKARRRR